MADDAERKRHRRGYDQGKIIRTMIRRYAQADRGLDIKEFQRRVEEVMLPQAEGDERLQEELKMEVELFLEERKR